MRRILALGVTVLLAAGASAGCGDDSGEDANDGGGSPQGSGGPIEITAFVVASLTGDATPYGTAQTNGITLAVEELAGDDVAIDLEVLDDESVAEGGVAAVTRAVDAGASVILGPTLSPVAVEADPIAVDAGIPVLGVTNSTLDLGSLPTAWRICKSEEQQIDATVRWSAVEGEPMDAALLVDASDGYSVGAGDAFESSAVGAGWTVERFEAQGADDAAASAASALASDPDVVLIAARSDAAVRFAEATVGFDGQRLGGNGFNAQEVLDSGGAAVDGIVVSASWNLVDGRGDSPDFVASYAQRFGSEPDAFAAQGYAAVQVLIAAARQAGSGEASAIQRALGELETTDTILGPFEFHAERSPTYTAVVQLVQEGGLVPATGSAGS